MRLETIRRGFVERLRSRRSEIEQLAMVRIQAVSDSREGSDPEYRDGLRAAVSAALDYGIEALERSEDRPAPIPNALLSQARLAARYGVKIETVLRRYLAGSTLLGDFMIEESERGVSMNRAELKRLLRVQAAVLDRLVAAVSEEYGREAKTRLHSVEQRRLRRVEQLLAGDQLDTPELAYDLNVHHVGLIASGNNAIDAVNELSRAIDCQSLIVRRDERTVWAWFGRRRGIDPAELQAFLTRAWSHPVSLGLGEPGEGRLGWRLTHRQAQAATSIALSTDSTLTRYVDIALRASIQQDDVLSASLSQLYLEPLKKSSGGGVDLRATLRAYFASGRNVSSAAASLCVHRRTVTNRLRAVEDCVGRSLEDCAIDLELALELDRHNRDSHPH